MNTTFIKICGLRTHADVKAAVAAGANAIGFVFAESPRQINPSIAAELAEAVPEHIVRVAVMRAPTRAQCLDIMQSFKPDWLQMEAANCARVGPLDGIRLLPVYRDTPALDEDDIEQGARVMFEGAQSGRGQVADWERAARLARRTRLILAGGLHAANLLDATMSVCPWGVDVSSGVERSPGVKDPHKITAFIKTVRNMESAHAD